MNKPIIIIRQVSTTTTTGSRDSIHSKNSWNPTELIQRLLDDTVSTANTNEEIERIERDDCFPFVQKCQDCMVICSLLLVGAVLLAAGIALCVIGTSIVIGSLLAVAGVFLLLTSLGETIFFCQNHCKNKSTQEARTRVLEAEILQEERLFDAIVQTGDRHDELNSCRQRLQKLYLERENMG